MSKKHIDYKDITPKEQQKITQGSIIPRPIAWITTTNENGTINLAPFSYFAVFSSTLLAVSFTKLKTEYKDTYVNLMREKEGVVHLGSLDLLSEVDESSKGLPYNESELDGLSLTLEESTHVKTPYLKESKVSFEVRVEESYSFMDLKNEKHENDVVFMRIIQVHLDEDVYDEETGYIDVKALGPISRLNGPLYGTVKPLDLKRKY